MRKEATKILGAMMLVAGSFVAQPLHAQQNQQMPTEQMMGTMKILMKGMLEVYSSPDVTNAMASFCKNLYDALVKRGFTKEEALQIVVAQGNVLTSSKN